MRRQLNGGRDTEGARGGIDVHETAGSLLITAVAVVGTLIWAMLAQRQANRSMAQELDRLDRRLVSGREERVRREVVAAHRASYTAANTAARRYLIALTNQLHAVRLGDGADLERATADLHRARAGHADCYAEIQMVAPGPVLAAAHAANRALNDLDGMLMRLTQGEALAGDSPAAAHARITALWDEGLAELRECMRLDLGIGGASRLDPAR